MLHTPQCVLFVSRIKNIIFDFFEQGGKGKKNIKKGKTKRTQKNHHKKKQNDDITNLPWSEGETWK